MENNSELNNRAAQYTLCFNAQCSKAESCLRHSMTQYNTAQNARLSVINPLCYPAAGKECPHFRTNKKVRVAWGFKTLYDNMPARISHAIHLNLEAIFRHSPYYRYRNQKLGLTPKQQECIRQVCKSMVGMRRLYSIGYRRVRVVNVSAGTPAKVSTEISQGEFDGQRLVQEIPPVGTVYTLLWYTSYHGEVQTIPN